MPECSEHSAVPIRRGQCANPWMVFEEEKVETYVHVVVKKIRRAGIVGLFAVGLAFAGVAPANALRGPDWQTSDLGKMAQRWLRSQCP